MVGSYTGEEIKVKFILDCLYAESKNQRTAEAHDIMAISTTLHLYSEAELVESKAGHQPLMILHGHSRTGDTKTA